MGDGHHGARRPRHISLLHVSLIRTLVKYTTVLKSRLGSELVAKEGGGGRRWEELGGGQRLLPDLPSLISPVSSGGERTFCYFHYQRGRSEVGKEADVFPHLLSAVSLPK